jgi:hypothetical protein
MQVHKVDFYIYADCAEEADELKAALYDFVNRKRQQGIAVKASALTAALNKYQDNFFLNQFLKQNGNRK